MREPSRGQIMKDLKGDIFQQEQQKRRKNPECSNIMVERTLSLEAKDFASSSSSSAS